MKIEEKLYDYGIVPVVKIDDSTKAIPLAKALLNGGLPCAEITLRTVEGIAAIKNIADEMKDFCVGAGTVLTIEQASEAINAGAQFIVTPGFNPDVIEYCIGKGIPIFPGCSSPTDMERALSMGISTVKFFPSEPLGGVNYLKAVAGPYSSLKFMPTGGINEKNINSYLSFDKIIACGGSWMVKDELINNDKFDEITTLTKSALKTIMGFKLAHVGINTNSEEEALKAARKFSILFDLELKPGAASVFSGKYIECLCSPYLGKNGHIAFFTNNITRAMQYLERSGFEFNMESLKYDDKGKMIAVYLKEEIVGFAIHLLQNDEVS